MRSLGVDVDDRNRRTGVGQALGGAEANAAGATGDDGHAALKIKVFGHGYLGLAVWVMNSRS